jgi:hydrophobic/amphiphilic exporter-1 (mainly G- bacteria), HAE1 family
MWLTNLAIRRPIVILMVFSAVIVMSLISRARMPIDLYPKVDFPYMMITTIYPGAGPEEVETQVSKQLEDAVASVSGVKEIMSRSQESLSVVGIEFELGTNLDSASADVRARVDAARSALPRDARIPVIQKLDVGAIPVLWLGMSSERPSRELRELADDVISDRLSRLAGVAAVTISGGEEREIQVNVDKHRLDAYGISILQVSQALSAGNLNLPGGRITEGGREYSIRAVGEFDSIDDIRNLRIGLPGGTEGLNILTIGDIAEVKDTSADREIITRLQKNESIGILVQKQSDANTVEVVDAAKLELEHMKALLPDDVSIAIVLDQSVMIRDALADVNTALVIGAILAVIVIFLFLHSLRGTLIVAVAIPACMIMTFLPVYFAGLTMNMMTMLALALAIGILVDGSIVVLENIYRHLSAGEDPKEAASKGLGEIGTAVLSITLVDVVVFVPIAFMGGIVGMFFREFGITVVAASIFSLVVAFTLTPLLASRLYRPGDAIEAKQGFFLKFDRTYEAIRSRYSNLLSKALDRRGLVIGTAFGLLFIILIVAGSSLGGDFFPRFDQSEVQVTIEMPTDASLEATNLVVSQVEDVVLEIPEVKNVFSTVGSAGAGIIGSGMRGSNYGQVVAALHDRESVMDRLLRPFRRQEQKRIRSDEVIAEEMRHLVARIPGGDILVGISSGMGGGGAPIDIELTGGSDEERNAVAEEIVGILRSMEGVVNPDVSWRMGKPEVTATIDRTRAAHMGLSASQIAGALRMSIEGSTDTKFRQNGKEYDIRVRMSEFDRNSLSDVNRVIVGSFNGSPVRLMDVAEISRETGPTMIERRNRQRKVSVTASLARGYDLQTMQQRIEGELKNVDFGNVRRHFGGDIEMMRDSFGRMFGALLLAIALVFMVLAALFESLFLPFVILITLPLSLIGAIIALVIAGETMSVVSMIGVIMLMGLVGKNAIVLIDYTNTLRSRGMGRKEALLEAGATRLRPILMLTLTMVFAMLPTALKLGRGAEMRAPMAIAVIGGLIVSTLLTLVFIPVLYTVFDDLMGKYQARKKAILGGRQSKSG